jgi:hypothetical protein
MLERPARGRVVDYGVVPMMWQCLERQPTGFSGRAPELLSEFERLCSAADVPLSVHELLGGRACIKVCV